LSTLIEYAETARKQLRKLDKAAARRIVDFMDERVAAGEDPRGTGKALKGPLGDLWRIAWAIFASFAIFRTVC